MDLSQLLSSGGYPLSLLTLTEGLLLTSFTLLTVYWCIELIEMRRHFPPGPLPLPIIGNLHLVIWHGSIITFLDEMRSRYGDVYTIVIAGSPRVVINGYDIFHDLLVKKADVTSNRTHSILTEKICELTKDAEGLTFARFPVWKEQRKFVLTTFRGQGMGKMEMEPNIINEISHYLKFLIEKENKPFDLANSIHFAVANILSTMLFGSRFEYDDPDFFELVAGIRECLEANLRVCFTKNVPFIGWLPGDVSGRHKIYSLNVKLIQFMERYITDHKNVLDPNNPTCFIDYYLNHMNQQRSKDPGTSFTDANLTQNIISLLFAGLDTTSSILRWIFLHIALNQTVQERIHNEIDSIVGQDQSPSYRDKLPLVEATLKEVLRIANVVPTALPHKVEQAIEVQGHVIPANSEIMLNMSSVLYDERVFPDPHCFRPERFLTEGTTDPSAFIPFGLGRRACPGESLARMELFLFFTSIMQRYKIIAPPGVKLSTEGIASTTNGPKPYQVIFVPRYGDIAV